MTFILQSYHITSQGRWNQSLMEDVLCRAYINLLEDVASLTPPGIAFPFYTLWPMVEQINQPVWMPLLIKFYESGKKVGRKERKEG